MSPADTLNFAGRAALGYPLRSALMVLAMAIGVAAVVVLTALGDGARHYVVGQFAAFVEPETTIRCWLSTATPSKASSPRPPR